jgi:TetR/AcrR family transcriptional repressor of nem operon
MNTPSTSRRYMIKPWQKWDPTGTPPYDTAHPKIPSLDNGNMTSHLRPMPQVSHKTALLDAAMEVFHQQGFNASSVDDIVRAARVPKGSFYNHFLSKEALALEVTRRYAAETRLDMLTASPASPNPRHRTPNATPNDSPSTRHGGELSPLARLRAHFAFLIERDVTWGLERGCILGNFATELARQSPTVRDAVRDAYSHWSAAITTVLDAARAAHEIAPDADTHALADFLIDAFEGATARAKVTGSRTPFDQFLSLTFSTILPSPPISE